MSENGEFTSEWLRRSKKSQFGHTAEVDKYGDVKTPQTLGSIQSPENAKKMGTNLSSQREDVGEEG